MPTKQPRINLIVPAAIAQRVRIEGDFLGVRSKVIVEGDRELRSTADFIRWVADLYIEACEAGEVQAWDYDETDTIAFTLDSHTKGRWEYAIKYYYATSYHQLVSFALCRYFDRLDQQTESDAQVIGNLQVMPVTDILSNLRRGEYGVFQAPRPVG